ncbi:hypothetical protein [Thiomicrorhabdus sp.]|uniref:hypothetical protein n=1 Tax=Thiomicrorhabdus sp. TaxID=2039724 RepID=UPI0029C8A5F5|nr:hypothetical protein [Thiomicrorhabdus sp.]
MDILDQAEHQESVQREMAIKHARQAKGPCLTPSGWCHYCGEEVPMPKLFCNGTCATKYNKNGARA